jgi:medium-chain acyl-[acyl-carrier-protein] hydrolase
MTTTAPLSWLACRTPNSQARLRLFCFPYAGGGASIFRTWSDGLSAEIEVCPVQLPGRGTRLREPPFRQLSSLVQALAQALFPYFDKPFAFFGHSLGALVSFELARQLRRQYSVEPVHLFVSACCAPQIPNSGAPLHTLPDPALLETLRHLNGTPREILKHEELMRLMLPVLRADFAVYETYAYSTELSLDCPISTFGGLHDRSVSRSDLEAWRAQTNAFFSLRMLPGNHFFLNTAKPLLLRVLSQDLFRLMRVIA